VSSYPVIKYLTWDRESDFAYCWVRVRVGMRPWYMMVRLMRSMCMPHVHPSVCWGVLWIWVTGLSCRRSGVAISIPDYYWRRVLCIMLIPWGGQRFKESK